MFYRDSHRGGQTHRTRVPTASLHGGRVSPGLVPFIPAIIGAGASLIGANVANKSNQAAASNATNQAQTFQTDQTAAANAAQKEAQANALQRLLQHIQSDPNPAQAWAQQGIQAPPQIAPQSVGGGVLGSNGMPTMPQPQAQAQANPQAIMQLIQRLIQQRAQMQPPQAQQPPATPQPGQQLPAQNAAGINPIFRNFGPGANNGGMYLGGGGGRVLA